MKEEEFGSNEIRKLRGEQKVMMSKKKLEWRMKDIMIKIKKQEGPTKWVKQTMVVVVVVVVMMMMMMMTDVMIAFAMKTMNTVFVPDISLVCLLRSITASLCDVTSRSVVSARERWVV
jgi:hypothetical protein